MTFCKAVLQYVWTSYVQMLHVRMCDLKIVNSKDCEPYAWYIMYYCE